MSLNQISSLLSLTCPLHPDEPLNLFCQLEDCPAKGLICCVCEAEAHKHAVTPLKLLIKAMQNDLHQFENNKSLVLMAAQIDFEFNKSVALLDSLKSKEDAESLEESIHHYFRKLGGMLLKPKAKEVLEIVEKGKNPQVNLNQLNEFLLSYSTLYKQTKPSNESSNYATHLNELIADLAIKYADFQKSINNNSKAEILYQIYNFSLGSASITYYFSPVFKNSCHTITQTTTITQQNNYNTNFCLIEPSIEGTTRYNPSPKTIRIRIAKLTSWIGLGLIHGNIAKASNYYFNTASTGHGGYMVSNDGYSWHHHTSTLNSFYNSFSFQQGDIIVMTANLKTKTLKFYKEKSPENTYELSFEISTTDKLYFGVSLSSHQESVEIINT